VIFKTYRSACLNEELADGGSVVHGVERSDFVNAHGGHLEEPSDLVHDADGGEAVLALAEIEDRHNGGLLVLGWVSLEDLCDKLLILGVELERDIGVIVGRVAMHLKGVALAARGAGYGAGLEGSRPPDRAGS
jgi:hypothetical protein